MGNTAFRGTQPWAERIRIEGDAAVSEGEWDRSRMVQRIHCGKRDGEMATVYPPVGTDRREWRGSGPGPVAVAPPRTV